MRYDSISVFCAFIFGSCMDRRFHNHDRSATLDLLSSDLYLRCCYSRAVCQRALPFVRFMIFAVDPGSMKSAFVMFDPAKQRIVDLGIMSNHELLKQVSIGTERMTVFAIERVASFGFSVGKEIFDTVEWTGRFIQAVSHLPVTIYPVYRKQVVTHHTGRSTSGDKHVRAAMIVRFGKKNLAGCKYDLWSALAVAAFASDQLCAKVTDTSL